MKTKRLMLLASITAFAVGALMLVHTRVLADMAPIQYWGNGVVTTDPKGIVLTKENLEIEMVEDSDPDEWNDYFKVKATFYFNNPGDATDLDVFFPVPGTGDIANSGNTDAEKLEFLTNEMAYSTFKMTLNGSRVTDMTTDVSEYDPQLEGPGGMTIYNFAIYSTLHFKSGQNTLVCEYSSPVTYNYEGGLYTINYVLSSGALWADPIGELNISVKFADEMLSSRYTSTYAFTNSDTNTLEYQGLSIEPTDELSIDYIPSPIWEVVGPIVTSGQQPSTVEKKVELCALLQYEIGNKDMVDPDGEGVLYDIYWQNVVDLAALGNHDFDLDYGLYRESLLREVLNEINERACENDERGSDLTELINQFSDDKASLSEWVNGEAVFGEEWGQEWGQEYLNGLIERDVITCEINSAIDGPTIESVSFLGFDIPQEIFTIGVVVISVVFVAGIGTTVFFLYTRHRKNKNASAGTI